MSVTHFESRRLIGSYRTTSLLFLKSGLMWNLLSLLWSLKRATITKPSKAIRGGGSFFLFVHLTVSSESFPSPMPPRPQVCYPAGPSQRTSGRAFHQNIQGQRHAKFISAVSQLRSHFYREKKPLMQTFGFSVSMRLCWKKRLFNVKIERNYLIHHQSATFL